MVIWSISPRLGTRRTVFHYLCVCQHSLLPNLTSREKSEFVMSSCKEIGKISLVAGHPNVEWTIMNFLSYSAKDVPYNSPLFNVSGSQWRFQINPNGDSRASSIGWIGLYLCRENVETQQGVNFEFGMKRVDGTVEKLSEDSTIVFGGEDSGWGSNNLLQRSELLRRKSELVSSGMLTVTCTLRTNKSVDSSTRLGTLSQNLFEMFISKKGCDVTLKVQHEEFLVHKFILSARSSVFAAVFEVDMMEKNTGIVNIVDCDLEAFKEFLSYLYSGKAEKLSNNAVELYKIADKYDVEELKVDCLTYIMTNLTVENIFDAVGLGDQFSLNSLKIKTNDFFNKNFKKIALSAKWESFLVSNGLLANQLLKNMASKMK